MRTVKRTTLLLNTFKHSSLERLCAAYAREKQYWLDQLRSREFQSLLGCPRKIRDQFVQKGYQSKNGLQARHWKLALQEAAETWDKYWQALFVRIRSKIFRHHFKENESRYAYFLIKGYAQFAALMKGDVPDFELDLLSRKRVAGMLRRLVKRLRGKSPTVKKSRIAKFDANCYDLFEHQGRQYIKLMSLEKGKRLILPLEGKAAISGTITVVFSKQKISIHVCQELSAKKKLSQNQTAVDFGYTEVMTDHTGKRYGKRFGQMLTKKSDQQSKKNQLRNKLYALEKKCSYSKKARHIRKYNLGKEKFFYKKNKWEASLTCEINQAINQIIKTTQPKVFITENLSHLFTYRKSPVVNRRLSSWLRGEIQNRVAFKALAEGFRHEQVNPAYGSQICPKCDFVDQKNRMADKFKCHYCRHEDISDRVAAENYAKRYGDLEITQYTPYREVKTILLDRFHRRLEREQSLTVPGRTLETVSGMCPPAPVEITHIIAGREKSRQNRTVNQRAKQNKHV